MNKPAAIPVGASPSARDVLREWKESWKKSPNSANGYSYTAVKAAIEGVIAHPVHAMDGKHQLRGELKGVSRLKCGNKSRYRVFYLHSKEKKRSIVLMVGYRRADSRDDAYEEFTKALARGDFDEQFEDLGIPLPSGAGSRK